MTPDLTDAKELNIKDNMPKKLFTSEYQPVNKGRKSYPDAIKKQGMTVYVEPQTKVYLKAHKVKGGKVLDEYVKEKTK